ncbi:MAG: nicotinate phosphoribosyltransferase [Acidobacteriota bacterium]|nr:nicotinate phosphoribosyltransferase [Acidobacteriota bacterium]MDE2924369.1 nicotinate phosphoribosyltransferase [Acidobacteriota bacterium]MDE3264019.1 nicotinate phosphoribosyltransferase [Acidobacteriota bacterium]
MSALTTDLYQLTMAQGYWRNGRHLDRASFYLSIRHTPFDGGFAVAAGLEQVVEFLVDLRFEPEDIEYLRSLAGSDGRPLFARDFLEALPQLDLAVSLAAVPEGTAVFAREPLLRIEAPLLVGQLIETPVLNIFNFQTLVATKAARLCHIAAPGQPVLEFGLRRAQGFDGGLSASRAAYVGGCFATSNVEAGQRFGIPVRGTHAHSWVQAFDSEPEAFDAFAETMPNNCVLLVDTYDVERGIEHAIATARMLERRGQRLLGIRLDSGDLLLQSRAARRRLNEAGLEDVAIVVSDNLDEKKILALRRAGAAIDIWGVGTSLVTAAGAGALGGVYKLSAIRRCGEEWWRPVFKFGAGVGKASLPGRLQVRRYRGAAGGLERDVIHALDEGGEASGLDDPGGLDLLVPVLEEGRLLAPLPSLDAAREIAGREVASLPPALQDLEAHGPAPVEVTASLMEQCDRLAASHAPPARSA